MSPPEKDLAGEYVVAHVQVVVREASPRVAENRDSREYVLEAGGAALGAGPKPLQENVFRYVVGRAHAVNRIGAEVLNAERTEVAAQLEVLGLDLRRFHHAAVDLRLNDRRLPLRVPGPAPSPRARTHPQRDSSPAARRTLLSRISILPVPHSDFGW